MNVGSEIIVCPICEKIIHRHLDEPIAAVGRVATIRPDGTRNPNDYQDASNLLTQMMLDANEEHARRVQAAEDACNAHFEEAHPFRLKLWKRFGKSWLLDRRWPWRRPLKLDYEEFRIGAGK